MTRLADAMRRALAAEEQSVIHWHAHHCAAEELDGPACVCRARARKQGQQLRDEINDVFNRVLERYMNDGR